MKVIFLLVQLGAPKEATYGDVRQFLKLFLGNFRVIKRRDLLWKFIFNFIILLIYPLKSKKKYQEAFDFFLKFNKEKKQLENNELSREPIIVQNSLRFTKRVDEELKKLILKSCDKDQNTIQAKSIFLYYDLDFNKFWQDLESDQKNLSYEQKILNWRDLHLCIIPQFPQYAESTQAIIFDEWSSSLKSQTLIPSMNFVSSFCLTKCYLEESVNKIISSFKEEMERNLNSEKQKIEVMLILSFHGLPTIQIEKYFDPYLKEVQDTYNSIISKLFQRDEFTSILNKSNIEVKTKLTFQSKWGRGEWLAPSLEETVVEEMDNKGRKIFFIHNPCFLVECLETILDIEVDIRSCITKRGGKLIYIPTLGEDPNWIKTYSEFLFANYLKEKNFRDEFYESPETIKQ